MSAAAVAVSLVLAQYSYLPFKNLSDNQNRFQYYVDNRVSMPANLDVNQVRTAAETAWASWNALSCAAPKSQAMGFTTGVVSEPSNPYDAFNVTPIFITSRSDVYFANAFSYDLSAVALPLQYGGVLQQCDVYLNATNRTWSTATPPPLNALDVESAVLHEAGHCLGLDHNGTYPNTVMTASILPGEQKRALATDDVNALCQRYPLSGAVGSPCPDGGGCPNPLKCVTQPMAVGPPARFCTRGCPTGQNFPCELPLSCAASTAFTPTFDGACLRPSSTVTAVSKPCMNDNECESSVGYCQDPVAYPTGTTFWVAGYCSQACGMGNTPCPAGSKCTTVPMGLIGGGGGGTAEICLASCRVGFADCRPGYSCAPDNGGVCIPSCRAMLDCGNGSGFFCNNCDGLCQPVNSPTQPGDICDSDLTCGFSQQCIAVNGNSGIHICSSGCGGLCANGSPRACPAGSSCHPIDVAGGQFFCLRNCTGPGTCPTGLQCANLATGRGCMPPCRVNSDCPVGLVCSLGECGNPMVDPDGGCGLLCTSEDGGVPIKPKPKDAGVGGGGNGGCGCNSSPASLLFALMGLEIFRPWRRRRH